MIAQVKGRLVEKNPAYVVVDCSGVGYHINVSLHTFSKLGDDENILLYTHLIVREDAQLLYGFADKDERHLFEQLISVSGVGASTAIMMLSSLQPLEIIQAISDEDVALLKSVKGIGRKSAERIVVDLKDKISKGVTATAEKTGLEGNTIKDEALSALVMLGFSKSQAKKAVDKELKKGEELKVEVLIKKALKNL